MEIMLPKYVFVFACFLGAVGSTAAAGSDSRQSDGEFELHSQQALLRNFGQMIGYSQIFTNKPSNPLFSEDEMHEIISHESHVKEIRAKDYPDPCAHDLVRVALNIRQQWAISMIDADGKLPPGLVGGNLLWPGSYKECLAIEAPADPTDNQKGFGGRYCALSWSLPSLKISVVSGLCIPDTCNEADFSNITNVKLLQESRNILPKLLIPGNFTTKYVSLTSITCQPKTTEYSAGAIVVLVILFMCLFLVIAGTSLTAMEVLFPLSPNPCQESADSVNSLPTEIKVEDAFRNYSSEKSELVTDVSDLEQLVPKTRGPNIFDHISNFLKCFCLIKNGSKILDTSDKGGTELRCIHGIRFLSMAWVVLGHTFAFAALTLILGNTADVVKIAHNFLFLVILQAPYSVDSFFVMSGFLLTFLFLREMNTRGGKISWLAFYLHRYWRLTPVYAVVMAFDMTVSWYLISGPFRPQVYESGCHKTWWYNLLYINNFAPETEPCIGWAWYLANDMQFYVISPMFLYALWRWPKIGLGIVISLFCGSWISNFAISYHYDLLPGYSLIPELENIGVYMQQMTLYFDKLYIKPYTRIGPYLIGVVLGYVFYAVKDRKNFLSKVFLDIGTLFYGFCEGKKVEKRWVNVILRQLCHPWTQRNQAIGWTASTAMGLVIMFGLYHSDPTRVGTAFYNAFDRCCFSASLAWVIFACLTGHGGVVNKILSHPIFIPLGRLTYCAYLIHPILMTVYYMSLPSVLILTNFQMVVLFFGFLVASYGIAFATTLMLESPTMAIEKLLRSGTAAK